jgi:hypothetical protein
MLFKIIIGTLGDFVAVLVLSLACCCMMIARASAKAAMCLGNAERKIRGVKCDDK